MKQHSGTLLIALVVALGTATISQVTFDTVSGRDAAASTPLFDTRAHLALPADFSTASVLNMEAGTVVRLKDHFNRIGYDWRDTSVSVPRIRLASFPSDLSEVPEPQVRKQLFFQSLVPIVLMENNRVTQERTRMQDLFARMDEGYQPSAMEISWLLGLTERYRVKDWPTTRAARKALDLRVQQVPVSLTLAMAAFESGWGTSRFADEGNNLFGQWTYKRGTGIVPNQRDAGRRHELAVFPDLTSSVRAYIQNLNSHWAYENFRQERARLDETTSQEAAIRLATTLDRYSERGMAYVNELLGLIRANRMTRFDGARLHAPVPPLEMTATSTASNIS
ncbi:MAG: glucosaminidase domain-containing protein [Leptospirillia bacterium]